MEFLAHLNSFLQQSTSPLRKEFDEQKMNVIAQLADNDSFLSKKRNHIEHYIEDSTATVDSRVRGVFNEYKEAVVYINISKEF